MNFILKSGAMWYQGLLCRSFKNGSPCAFVSRQHRASRLFKYNGYANLSRFGFDQGVVSTTTTYTNYIFRKAK